VRNQHSKLVEDRQDLAVGGPEVRLHQRGDEDEQERSNVRALAVPVHSRVVREEQLHRGEGQEIVPFSRR